MKYKSSIILISIVSLLFISIITAIIYKSKGDFKPVLPLSTSNELSIQEVKTHNTIDNCYVSIGGAVYNLTSYIQTHQENMNKLCGKIEPDLKTLNLTIEQIVDYRMGILSL